MSGAQLPRGTVTFLFSDIEESTELVRRLGDNRFATIRADHRRLLRDAFAAHGGREIDTAGDGFFVAFDSARNAVAAAVDGQLALAESASRADAEVRVRMGLHTAEPHLAEDGYVGVGVHRAAASATPRAEARSSSRTRRRASSKTRNWRGSSWSTSASTD